MRVRKYMLWFWAAAAVALAGNLVRALLLKGVGLEAIRGNLLSDDVGLALFYFLLTLGLFLLTWLAPGLFKKKRMVNILLTLGSIAAALVLFDLVLMPFNLVFNAATVGKFDFQGAADLARRHPELRDSWDSKVNWMQKDAELGYRPMTGPNSTYSNLGAQHNPYTLAKPPGVVRVLFVGDSIAALGYLNRGLRELNPDKNYEYWDLGVYGYSTWQEVKYFERFGRRLKPDLVILEFCLNDWDGTPVIMKDEKGETLIANLYLGSNQFNYRLFKLSTLYRVWLSLKASFTQRAGLKDDVKRQFQKLLDYSRRDGFTLRVVIHPELRRYQDWPAKFKRQLADIRSILDELGIVYYDAAPLLDQALKTHPRNWARMEPGDHFHPSKAFGYMMAAKLLKIGFLKP